MPKYANAAASQAANAMVASNREAYAALRPQARAPLAQQQYTGSVNVRRAARAPMGLAAAFSSGTGRAMGTTTRGMTPTAALDSGVSITGIGNRALARAQNANPSAATGGIFGVRGQSYGNIATAVTDAANKFSRRYGGGVPLGDSRVGVPAPAVKRAIPNVRRISPRDVGGAIIGPGTIGNAPILTPEVPNYQMPNDALPTSYDFPTLTLGDELGGEYSGDAAVLYAAWAQTVKNQGGVATALNGKPVARYPKTVWVPKVNAGIWKQPDSYSRDGQYGYYAADAQVEQAATHLTLPSESELTHYGLFDAFNFLHLDSTIGKVVVGGALLWFAMSFMGRSGR